MDKIQENKQKNLRTFAREQAENGNYNEWYAELADFRRALRPYVKQTFFGNRIIQSKRTRLPSGDVLDHHVAGYFAPLNFRRRGFEGEMRTPADQLIYLSEYLKAHHTRFIYAALPCKGVFYPEIAVAAETLHGKTLDCPQWRKMLSELVVADVDVLDLLPPLMAQKDSLNLFSKDHYVSPLGAKAVAEIVAGYLRDTAKIFETDIHVNAKDCEVDFSCPDGSGGTVQEKYPARCISRVDEGTLDYPEARIGFFGNCNVQAYREYSAGIYENLLYELHAPVDYMGRFLPFACSEHHHAALFGCEGLTQSVCQAFAKKDIVVYLGFPTASFVRTSQFYALPSLPLRLLCGASLYGPWSTVKLKNVEDMQ